MSEKPHSAVHAANYVGDGNGDAPTNGKEKDKKKVRY